jgi:hypothetical protein
MSLNSAMPSISSNVLQTLNTVNKQVGSALTPMVPQSSGMMNSAGAAGQGALGGQTDELSAMMAMLGQVSQNIDPSSPEAQTVGLLAQLMQVMFSLLGNNGQGSPAAASSGLYGGNQLGGSNVGMTATPQSLAQAQQLQQQQMMQQMQLQQAQSPLYATQQVAQGGIASAIDPSILNGANFIGGMGNIAVMGGGQFGSTLGGSLVNAGRQLQQILAL